MVLVLLSGMTCISSSDLCGLKLRSEYLRVLMSRAGIQESICQKGVTVGWVFGFVTLRRGRCSSYHHSSDWYGLYLSLLMCFHFHVFCLFVFVFLVFTFIFVLKSYTSTHRKRRASKRERERIKLGVGIAMKWELSRTDLERRNTI